jgi:Ca2+-binding EF-hand superfamily protein
VSFSQLNLQQSPLEQNKADDEIERLKSMAQKLRAEASALEAERAQELAAAAEIVFRKFDTNKDGEISLEELKAGLEKALKIELSDKRAEQVMKTFNVSGDGKLQLDEMVGGLLAFVFI